MMMIMIMIDYDDENDDDDEAAVRFQKRRSVFNSCYPKIIQYFVHEICVTSVVVTPKFVRTP